MPSDLAAPRSPARRLALGLPVCLVVGFAVGVLATIKARSGVSSGVPYGLALGLLLVLVLVVGLRYGGGSRWFGVAGGAGVLAAPGLLTRPSAGGSVLVQADAAGIAWLVGSVIAVLLAVAVPLPRSASGVPAGPDGILVADEGTRP